MKYKALFLSIWFITLAFGPLVILSPNTISKLPTDTNLAINVAQRILGIMALTMLFWQIVIGAFMDAFRKKLGIFIFKFHLIEGPLAYTIIFAHPILYMIYWHRLGGRLDPFFVFTDFCGKCANLNDYALTLGRLSFWGVTFAVIAAKLRNLPQLKKHWRHVHILNYLVFFTVAIHSLILGTDTKTTPILYLYLFSIPIVLGAIIFKYKKSLT